MRPDSALTRSLLVVASGVLWGLAFAARPWLPLSCVALAPLILVLDAKRPFLWGWLHGVIAWCAALPWIVGTLTTYGHLEGWLAGVALLLLAAYLGLYHALFALFGARIARGRVRWALVGLPALWVLLEVVRGFALTGFPWNLAAYAWVAMPGALPLAAWIGAWGISFLVLLVNTGAALAVRRRRWEIAVVPALAVAILLAMGGRWGDPGRAGRAEARARERAEVKRAVIVQPDTPNQVAFDAARFERDYAKLLEMSSAACRDGALLVWPESAAWPLAFGRDPRLEADLAKLAAQGCPVLLNSIRDEGERYYNSMLLYGAGATTPGYDKRHLVPFGEYVPMKNVFGFLSRIARSAGDFSRAETLSLLDWNGVRFGPAICYEVVFPGEVAESVRAGATALVTITNDAWYGDTAAPWQHLAAARFRAAESRRWLLRAAITGVSAAVAPDGSLRGTLGVGEKGTIEAKFETRSDLSPFSRAPWLVPALSALLFAIAWLASRAAAPSAGAPRDSRQA